VIIIKYKYFVIEYVFFFFIIMRKIFHNYYLQKVKIEPFTNLLVVEVLKKKTFLCINNNINYFVC